MSFNPAAVKGHVASPIERANPLNDPKFSEQQGYNNYDLTNGQFVSPRFAEITPCDVFETVPGDRHLFNSNGLSILNQIDANVCSEINEYLDYFYVPLRNIYPNNYEKLIPNPTKGSDLPWKALPQVPLLAFIRRIISSPENIGFGPGANHLVSNTFDNPGEVVGLLGSELYGEDYYRISLLLNNLLYAAWILSRGNLLDYVGYNIEVPDSTSISGVSNKITWRQNILQFCIDKFFNALMIPADIDDGQSTQDPGIYVWEFENGYYETLVPVYEPFALNRGFDLSSFRAAMYQALEDGEFIAFYREREYSTLSSELVDAAFTLYNVLMSLTSGSVIPPDETPEPFDHGYINPSRLIAYQLSVAEFFSNSTVDNVFNAELWMQNVRAVMFPTIDGVTREPVFDYNGVDTEYDYFTTGAWQQAFFSNYSDEHYRILRFSSLVFNLRRSLRYGDYFSTGRPDLLAVGNIDIPVSTNAETGLTTVSPIDVTRNLLMQRYLNAANYTGPQFLAQMTSMFGVKPSDLGVHPRFIAHKKTPLSRNITTNTSQDQGRQSTNLLGQSESNFIDVFIDDFGIVIGVISYDALPVYTTGIDGAFEFSDRFSLFNPMLQNVGDQAIKLRELNGVTTSEEPFAYTMRYSHYKFGITKAHGAFVNDLPGYVMKYPVRSFLTDFAGSLNDIHISPDFIRDKPVYFDQFFAQRTGLSPAQYYHFIVSVLNDHKAARKMQYQPPVLF